MEIIIKQRGKGKTHEMLQLSSKIGHTIVCYDKNETFRIKELAKDMGLNIPEPITYRELKGGLYDHRYLGLLIDNADDFLQSFTSSPISAITLTCDEPIGDKHRIKIPKYVKLKDTELRLSGNEYIRDNGAWSVKYRIIDGKLLSWFPIPGLEHLHLVELIEITKEEWRISIGLIDKI